MFRYYVYTISDIITFLFIEEHKLTHRLIRRKGFCLVFVSYYITLGCLNIYVDHMTFTNRTVQEGN